VSDRNYFFVFLFFSLVFLFFFPRLFSVLLCLFSVVCLSFTLVYPCADVLAPVSCLSHHVSILLLFSAPAPVPVPVLVLFLGLRTGDVHVDDQVICLDEIKLSLMAQGAGICTMISNLCTSMTIEKSQSGHRWASEYLDGCDYEVYRVWLSPVFQGLQFAEVAEKIHSETGVLMFAIELHAPRADYNRGGLSDEELAVRNSLPPRIVLNPHNFIIPSVVEFRVHAFVIAGDRADALKVQHWGLPGFDHSSDGGLFQTLGALKKNASENIRSMGHLPDFLQNHVVEHGTTEQARHKRPRASVYSKAQKVYESSEAMKEMEEMMSGSSDKSSVNIDMGMAEEGKRSVNRTPGVGVFKTNKSSTEKHRASMFSRKGSFHRLTQLGKSEKEDLEYEAHLEEMRANQEMEVAKAAQEAEHLEKHLEISRKASNKTRLMSKLKKYAVKVGESKTDASGMKSRARKKGSLLGNALSESTWERLGAVVSTLDSGAKVELSHVIIETVKHLDQAIHHHIIACGPLSKLWSFILPLRSKHVQVVQPIVVLSRTLPTEEEWERYSRFPDIYLVRGNPLNISDLHAAGTKSASRAVLFADLEKKHGVGTGTHEVESPSITDNKFGRQMRDSSTILAYRALKVVNSRINVTVELISSENLRLLDESEMGTGASMHMQGGVLGDDEPEKKPAGFFESMAEAFGVGGSEMAASESWLSPSFASGHAFLSTVTDTIFAQSFYNRHLIAIIQELVIGTPNILSETWNKVLGSEIGVVDGSHLHLIVTPTSYHNRSYSFVLYSLLQKGVLAMGLRRGVTVADPDQVFQSNVDESNSQPYVYTNPSPSTIVRETDLLYVLCNGSPHELGLDIALFDYESKKSKKDLAESVVAKLKTFKFGNSGKGKNDGKKADTRRRGSMMAHMTGDAATKGERENVGVPESMIKAMSSKNKRRFSVVKTDLIHTSPMMKLAHQVWNPFLNFFFLSFLITSIF